MCRTTPYYSLPLANKNKNQYSAYMLPTRIRLPIFQNLNNFLQVINNNFFSITRFEKPMLMLEYFNFGQSAISRRIVFLHFVALQEKKMDHSIIQNLAIERSSMSQSTEISNPFGNKKWYNVTRIYESVKNNMSTGELLTGPSFAAESTMVILFSENVFLSDAGVYERTLYLKEVTYSDNGKKVPLMEAKEHEQKREDSVKNGDVPEYIKILDDLWTKQNSVAKEVTLPQQIDDDMLVGTLDEMIRLLWSFFNGNADRFSIYTCLYLHNEVRLHPRYKLPHRVMTPFVDAVILVRLT
ncbi:hypothetical protein RFI_30488 [Reticulomyxa filosa]|uniref:Uncharacterized protein n=1 Tax=Reticulomyxa filosa TaxID=46433 RepID=X6M1S1_RETFI|nr:hypothetical protein RFI_30488 [Reticulomyxa filosa]|eukprot:ETO06905.1 hypothetical protein RFI_30488 [Reticulomyxa filosa]